MRRAGPVHGWALLLLAAVGCSAVGSASSDISGGEAGTAVPDYGREGGPYAATADASSDRTAPLYRGNPLCNAKGGAPACVPDDPAACSPSDAASVHGLVGEGGLDAGLEAGAGPVSSGGTQDAPVACRVGPSGAPSCGPAGRGGDGDACERSRDCAAGFECVGSGPSQCRRYCCEDVTCGGAAHAFCDVQTVAGRPDVEVPVCIPVRPCNLLVGRCPDGQTCAIVNQDDGTRSCVTTGAAGAGESCDTMHCESNMTCLGEPGARKCYRLCQRDADVTTCGAGEKCEGSAPLFQDPNVGVCQGAAPAPAPSR